MLRLTSNVISWGSRVTQSWGARFIIRETQVLTSEEPVRRVFQPVKKTTSPTGACMCRKRHPVKSYRAQKCTPHSVGEPEWTSHDFPGQK